MKAKMRLPFAVLAAVPLVMVLGNSMLIPILPEMEETMNLTQFQVGLIITAFSVPAGLLIPFAGALSDHIGRKAIMAPALILYGLGGLVAGAAALLIAQPFIPILVGRVIQGIGAGGTYQIAMALTGDIFTSDERTKVLGLLEASNGLGKVASPILGAAFALIVWFAPFFVYGFLSIPVAFLVWFIVKEPKDALQKQSPSKYVSGLKKVFKTKGISLLALYAGGMTALFLLFGLLSLFSDDLEARHHITGFAKGLILAIPVGTMAITSYLGGTFMQGHLNLQKPGILLGVGLLGGSLAFMPILSGLWPFTAVIAVAGLGIGLMLPPLNNLITSATEPAERGLVTSLYGSVRFFGVAMGPPAFGLAVGWGRPVMFLTAAGLAGLALVIILFFVKTQKLTGDPTGKKERPASKVRTPKSARAKARSTFDEEAEGVAGEKTPLS